MTRAEIVIEDAEFMADNGESLSMAAIRLGYRSPRVLERSLLKFGRSDIVARLKAPEAGWHIARQGGWIS